MLNESHVRDKSAFSDIVSADLQSYYQDILATVKNVLIQMNSFFSKIGRCNEMIQLVLLETLFNLRLSENYYQHKKLKKIHTGNITQPIHTHLEEPAETKFYVIFALTQPQLQDRKKKPRNSSKRTG